MSFNNNCQRLLRRLEIVRVRSRAQETSADIAALTSCHSERVQSTFLKAVLPIRCYLCRFRMLRNYIRIPPKTRCDQATRPFENSHTQHTHIYVRVCLQYNIHASVGYI